VTLGQFIRNGDAAMPRKYGMRFSIYSALTMMTIVGVLVGMSVHARGPMIFGLILVSPFLFAGAMAAITNRSPLLSKSILVLLVTGIAFTLSLGALAFLVGGD
jgi:hypothetical protein